MSILSPESGIGKALCEARIIAVLVIDDAGDAVPLAEALLRGGVRAMELTLRTPVALEAAAAIRAALPEMHLGIGTLLTPDQIAPALAAGAAFGVAPGVNAEMIRKAAEAGLPFGPGVMTPSDVDLAIREGCRLLKFFPAGSSGGLAHLQNIAAPFAHLGPKFVPLGGINLGNLKTWLDSDLVAAVGGSWIAPREAIRAKDWGRIEENAREAMRCAQ
ncbi:MAG TPA: bifunctional 4-hydroxy-2-oxoglutarate aldolase/2-dehydro-3-deoxy-phosphogluconate aldolase [Bacteroidia bacterium]|nr:bifunctional 4-hydroxy-2-oxoglutarate aldolase/2-dehydro-3-deoxy-phosphogluconate aldolase [Bacteroidia bacterium]